MKKIIQLILIVTLSLSFNAMATGQDQAGWYVSFDVDQIKTKLLPVIKQTDKGQSNHFSLETHVPEEISHITLYGQHNNKWSTTAVLSGDLRHFSVMNYLDYLAAEAGENHPVKQIKATQHGQRSIHHYEIQKGDQGKPFYSSHINDRTVVASFSLKEVKRWIDGGHDLADLHQTSLVSVQVNIESALVHAGADLEQNPPAFQSHMFKKIKQFAGSVIEADDQLLVEAVLVTENDTTATQVQTVINGLIAMNALSDMAAESEDLKVIIENLSVATAGPQVQLLTQFPLALIADMDID